MPVHFSKENRFCGRSIIFIKNIYIYIFPYLFSLVKKIPTLSRIKNVQCLVVFRFLYCLSEPDVDELVRLPVWWLDCWLYCLFSIYLTACLYTSLVASDRGAELLSQEPPIIAYQTALWITTSDRFYSH